MLKCREAFHQGIDLNIVPDFLVRQFGFQVSNHPVTALQIVVEFLGGPNHRHDELGVVHPVKAVLIDADNVVLHRELLVHGPDFLGDEPDLAPAFIF